MPATKTQSRKLPLPPFVKLDNAAEYFYQPDQAAVFGQAAAWAKAHGIKPAASDKVKIEALLIDVQLDFCHPKGSLYVAGRSGTGAVDDNKRLATWLYENQDRLSSISATMDTHTPYQIFFQSFWKDEKTGGPVTPFRFITLDQIRKGEVTPNPAVCQMVGTGYPSLKKYVEHYAQELEKAKKYQLYVWPFHCQLRSFGHAMTGLIYEAILFHGFVRGVDNHIEIKGGHPLTENYSVLSPEVLTWHDGSPLAKAQRNVDFIKKLLSNDAVVIAGQADSHCVKSSIDDLLTSIVAQDPELAKKVYIMTDCMSAVTVPDGKGGFALDCTADAEAAHKKFADAGMHLVKSTDPIESWPGIKL